MKNKIILTTLVIALASSANAAVISDIGAANSNALWPTTPLFETMDSTTDNNGRGITDTRPEFVQTFSLTSAIKIDKIYFEGSSWVAGVDFRIRIFEVSDVNDNTAGTVVLSPIVLNTGTITGNNRIAEIDLIGSEEITLSAGQGYGFAMTTITAASTAFAWKFQDNNNVYSGGRGFGDSNITNLDDFTLAFTGTVVPEPSSLALLGAAGGLLMMRRRRQG